MDVKALREKHKAKQEFFWAQIGIGQSLASRYECGNRAIPRKVHLLLELAYGDKPLEVLARLRETTVAELVKKGEPF